MLIALLCLLANGLVGCNRIGAQADAESKFANYVILLIRKHYALSPQIEVTNLAQLFPLVNHGYPYFYHQEISRFGRNAGFTNSLGEKYIFFEVPFTHRSIDGKVICISAQPFPDRDDLHRIYIAEKDGNYIYRPIPEHRLQVVLQEAKANPMPVSHDRPPPPPPEVRARLNSAADQYEKFVWDLSGALDQDSSMPVRLGLAIAAGVCATILVVCGIFFLRRVRS